ncbi:isochorismatase family protein [Streptomyces albus]|uniref:isochorismatase family protein n=1 Tax=Streptomyces albus TaxID=1888 RepID=UPI0024ADAC32|nr:isochorismatase family protein [Streptomyces albus]MDI6410199.1 isochorismatase family protein [Streptomyces albus]
MRIPADVTYPMPRHVRGPAEPVLWRFSPDRAALLVHDMQRYFLDFFAAGASPRRELTEHTALLLAAARDAGVPVLYTAQPGAMTREQRGLLHQVWGPGMSAAPEHQEIDPAVAPREGEAVLTKWRYSAFVRTDLLERLTRLGRDQLVVCGVYAHIGCLITAVDAFSHDVQPFLVADAMADFTPEYHALALDYARERCAEITTTAALLSGLRAHRPGGPVAGAPGGPSAG